MMSLLLRRFATHLTILGLAAIAPVRAQYWVKDQSFHLINEGEPGQGGSVNVLAYPNRRLLLDTGFAIINGEDKKYQSVRFTENGTVDPTFAPLLFAREIFFVYPDGRVLFATLQDTSTATVVVQRVLSDGSPDPAFNPFTISNDSAHAVLMPDGRILFYGDFQLVAGENHHGMALVEADGTLVSSFAPELAPSTPAVITEAKPSADGQRIYVIGRSLVTPAGTRYVVALHPDGSVDDAFDSGGAGITNALYRVYPEASGSLLVADSGGLLTRITASGSRDATFSPALAGTSQLFGPRQLDGKIYYTCLVYGQTTEQQLHRMDADGTDDPTFQVISTPRSGSYVVGLPVLSDDGTLFLGPITAEQVATRQVLTHVFADGSVDTAYQPRFSRYSPIAAFDALPDGRQLVAGNIDHINNVATTRCPFYRLDASGNLDPTFDTSSAGISAATSVKVLASGKIVAVGGFPMEGGVTAKVMRFNADGTVDASFSPIVDSSLLNIAVAPDGAIYATPTSPYRIVRYLANGQLDPDFSAPVPTQSSLAILPFAGGKSMLLQWPYSGTATLMRLGENGSVDSSFPTKSLSKAPVAAAAMPDGSLILCTLATAFPGSTLLFQRVTADGTIDYSYNTAPFQTYYAPEAIQLDAAAVFSSLVKQASPNAYASAYLDLSQTALHLKMVCDSEGTAMLLQATMEGSGYTLSRYLRSPNDDPGFHAAPTVSYSYPPLPSNLPQRAGFFCGVTAGGLAPFTYKWYRDGELLAGKTSSGFYIEAVQPSDAGSYTVEIRNDYGTVTSDPIVLAVDSEHSAPFITTQPQSREVVPGASYTLSVVAGGNPSPTFQWRFNGAAIPGAVSAELPLQSIQASAVGRYDVIVQNSISSSGYTVASSPAYISLATASAPQFTANPEDLAVAPNQSAQFNGSAVGVPSPSLHWQRLVSGGGWTDLAESAPYAGTTSPTLTINPATLSMNGFSYRLAATNDYGTNYSTTAGLAVAKLAQDITFDSVSDRAFTSSPLGLSAGTSSNLAIAFRVVSGPASVSGNQLTLTGTGIVVVEASQPGDDTYAAATPVQRSFTVTGDLASWSLGYFDASERADSSISGPDADPDRDGLSNLVEYALGLDPRSAETTGLPEVASSGGNWTFTFTRPADRTDITYAVETSTDLVNWTSENVTLEQVTATGDTETWRATVPQAPAASAFFRLKVTQP